MEDIIGAFGIDQRLIIIQIINFAILALALGYFLYRPVLKMLADRAAKITQGLADAAAAEAAKHAAEAEKQVVLTAAHHEAEAVGARAKTAADEKASEIVGQAQNKASEVLKNAEANSLALKAAALKESEKEVAKLAILASEKILQCRA